MAKKSSQVSFQSIPESYKASDFNSSQDNRVLPRNIFASGVLPGNTVVEVGLNGPLIDGKNKIIGTGSDGTRVVMSSEGKLLIYNSTNQLTMILDGNSLNFNDALGDVAGAISFLPLGFMNINTSGQFDIYVSNGSSLNTIEFNDTSTNTYKPINIYTNNSEGFGTIIGSLYYDSVDQDLKLNTTAANGLTTNGIFQALAGAGNISYIAHDLLVGGDLSVVGSKAFEIDHPLNENKKLKYICPESPEALIMCRGIADTEDDIVLPDHFVAISEPDTTQIQIGKLYKSDKISWIATAVRKGYKDFNCEPDKI